MSSGDSTLLVIMRLIVWRSTKVFVKERKRCVLEMSMHIHKMNNTQSKWKRDYLKTLIGHTYKTWTTLIGSTCGERIMVHVIKLSLARDVIQLKVVQDKKNGAEGFNKIVSFIIHRSTKHHKVNKEQKYILVLS